MKSQPLKKDCDALRLGTFLQRTLDLFAISGSRVFLPGLSPSSMVDLDT